VPGFVRLLAVVIPPQAASAAIEHPVDEKATRIACADPGSVVEVDVLLQRLPADADSWPGKGAMNTHLLGRLRFWDEYEIVVVWHYAQDLGLEHRAEVIRKSVARAVDRPRLDGLRDARRRDRSAWWARPQGDPGQLRNA
jgi:hypothetical protein